MKTPCKQCPFRDSGFAYDADALECLDDGEEPACHVQVGRDSIFAHAPMSPPTDMACAGYSAWVSEKPGFRRPPKEQG